MTWPIHQLQSSMASLDFRGRISDADASRQHETVRAALERLTKQPGVILADEVGMGKTFVALGVALIAAQQDKGRNPVVVMIPPSLREKWPRDAQVFAELCLKEGGFQPRFAPATRAIHFFRLLDDPPSRRPHVIFLNHGAFHVRLIDPWMKFALIRRAMHGMKLGTKRDALPRFAASILRVQSRYGDPDLYATLLRTPPKEWKQAVNAFYEDDPGRQLDDDPIPAAVIRVLERNAPDLSSLRLALDRLPIKASANLGARIQAVRTALNESFRDFWPRVLMGARFRSPLLVLDEAHHLKNPATRLASLFAEASQEDAALLSGALSDRFERMLFLTATPFQLGHTELVNVLRRFRAVNWKTLPSSTATDYDSTIDKLGAALDTAQQVATTFDKHWQHIPQTSGPSSYDDAALEDWWSDIRSTSAEAPASYGELSRAYDATVAAMKDAERQLKPWVIRHRRGDGLPDCDVLRRLRRVGRSVRPGYEAEDSGLLVTADQLLPFLLAARAHSVAERLSRTARERYLTFSEGLASSYEAFLETSRSRGADIDDMAPAKTLLDPQLNAYIARLKRVMPVPEDFGRHPKVAAVVDRVVDLWALGEKVVVFCHYRKTGQALESHVSAAIRQRLWEDLQERTGIAMHEAPKAVERFGTRFDPGEPMERYLRDFVDSHLAERQVLDEKMREDLHDIIRRFVRSSVFVARYFDPSAQSSPELLDDALDLQDGSGISLRDRLRAFIAFFANLSEPEQKAYLEALQRVQSGLRSERATDRLAGSEGGELLPNVRLANGGVRQDARQRLMLSFNTPFFPDVLIASSVLAEGVDLHLNCRHVIHHDLSWNPSDIEQRTGRVDRLGSRAEKVRKSVEVYLPFVAETQDEKQFRVVMDRERWFQVLMGEEYRLDETSVEKMATRIPLPRSAAHALAFELEISQPAG